MSEMPTATTVADNFFLAAMSPAFREDPYPLYERFRRREPLLRMADSIWFSLAHADVMALLRHPQLSSDESRATTEIGRHEQNALKSHSLLFMDPPDHTRLRGLIARAFTPRRIEGLRTTIEAIAAELIEDVRVRAPAGPVDLIESFAYPLPVRVVCALLGVPASDQARFTSWSRSVARSIDPSILRSPEIDAAIEQGERDLDAYLNDLLARCRKRPADDLLSALVTVEANGDRVTPQEVIDLARLLLIAGHETTVNLLGNGMLALLRAPDQLALLRQASELLPGAVDELLRFDSPVQFTQRIATDDLDLLGHKVTKGDEIMLILGAANRDAAVFSEPHRLDIHRDARRHVAFGGGIHHCMGAALARLEGLIAFKALLDAFPKMELAAPPVRRPTLTLRGLDMLLIAL